ncbi:MAG: M20/M25/M40 family metallo-hydrolase [Nitriliruptorales bacterium]|nr:M20/M25/M40 family metallo-hydrolase [Nitriliruptorales bacterium]
MTDTTSFLAPTPHDVRDALTARMPEHRADLEALVRIPSVSAAGFDPAEVRGAAGAVRDLLAARGFDHTRLLDVEGSHPAVAADHLRAGRDAPTVLLYAHYDVQPPGDRAGWTSPAFSPTERDGRLYGRGAADDKAGIMVHVAAVDAWLASRGHLPVNVKVLIEGEEETGSAHLGQFLEAYAEELRADVIVVTDSTNWKVGVPTLSYLLRGLIDCVVEVRSLDHALHSGMYGGPVPDALTGLVKLLAELTDGHGAVAVPGFSDDARPPTPAERERLAALDFDEQAFRGEAGMLPGVELTGDPDAHVLERIWMRPTATIIGIDAPSVAEASNTLVPAARAKLSLRLAPGQDPQRAQQVLALWLREHAHWGLHVDVFPGASAGAFVADPQGPAFEAAERALSAAFGKPVVYQGVGGSIPFIEPFSEAFGGAPALLTGVEDPDTRAHGIDESLHLDDWYRACLAEAYLLAELAATRWEREGR